MNVLYFTTIDPSGSSGQNIATKEIIHSIVENDNVNLTVICPKFSDESVIDYLGKCSIIYLPQKKSKSILWILQVHIWIVSKLKSLMNNKNIELLIARPGMTYLPLKLSKKIGVKTSLLVRGMILRKNFSFLKFKIIKYIELKNFKYADRVYVAYKDIYNEYIRYNSEKFIRILPNAVNPLLFPLSKKSITRSKLNFFSPNDYVIGFVGSLKEKHNLITLIHTISKLPENIKLLIVGDGEGIESLKNQVNNSVLSGRVVFTGRISHDKVHYYISSCDIMFGVVDDANPSNPIKCYEYLVTGRPIITTRKDEFLFVENEQFGYLLNSSKDVEKLKTIIIKESGSKKEYNEKVLREYIIKNHTWDRITEIILQDYYKCE